LGSLIDARRKSNPQQRHPLGQEQINTNTSNAFLLDRKIEVTTAGLLFKDITRNDIVSLPDSFRKTENADPLNRWIATYNIFRIHFLPHQLRFKIRKSHHSGFKDQLTE
jgi:hypothetical protein